MIYKFKDYKKTPIIRNHLNMGGSNPKGERIDVTNVYFERGGIPQIDVMGEYHFTRDRRENWYEELCKMKAGGVSIVATYIFWIYHEEIEGEFDFSGDRDIRKFVEYAALAGLDVVIRIGPWCHGECRNGGFPDWLLKKPYKLRDNNPGYMEKARIWYEKIYNEVKGFFYKDGGPIIGVQFENELVDNAEHLLALKKLALEIGYDAPLYTVTGWNSMYGAKIPVDEVVPVFAAYAEAPWAGHTNKLPPSPHYAFNTMRNDSAVGYDIIKPSEKDGWMLPYEKYPYVTCELGAGLHPTHHRRMLISGMDAYAMSLVKLGCGNNLIGYYMYHGGVNKIGKLSTLNESKATGYPNDYPVLNYDYHTALSSYGETGEQYGLLNLLHMFVADFGNILAPMENVEAEELIKATDLTALRYCMRTDGKGGFVFVNHYQRQYELEDVKDVTIKALDVEFPSFDVCCDKAFILPFNLKMGGNMLEYATCQLLAKDGNAYFFAAVDNIAPVFKFSGEKPIAVKPGLDSCIEVDEVKIVTLTLDQARYLRKLDGKIYLGNKCDIYLKNGKIDCVQAGDFDYFTYTENGFEKTSIKKEVVPCKVEFTVVEEPFMPPYVDQLNFGGERKRTWKKIKVTGSQGFVIIEGEYDVAQIYADGELVADNFYCGEEWRVPAMLLENRECYLVTSEMKNDFYREF